MDALVLGCSLSSLCSKRASQTECPNTGFLDNPARALVRILQRGQLVVQPQCLIRESTERAERESIFEGLQRWRVPSLQQLLPW